MTQPNKRRWFRFNLRMLLVVMTVICVWLGVKVNAVRRQKEAVAAILNAGGIVAFDYQRVSVPGKPDHIGIGRDTSPPGPAWLRQLIGDEYFRDVIVVSLRDSAITESDYARLANVRGTLSMSLAYMKIVSDRNQSERPIADDDLVVLEHQNQLLELDLSQANISNAGIKHLSGLTNLKYLNLEGSAISSEGFCELQKSLPNCQISGQ